MEFCDILERNRGEECLVNLQHLRYFVTLAHMRHYTRAAQALAITQPSLSHAISLMEEELGVPLFAAILTLTEDQVVRRLRARGLSSATENYYPADSLVDPADDMQSRSDKLVRRMEKRYLRALVKERNGAELSGKERFFRKIYLAGRKLRLLPELSDNVLVQFNVEESIREAIANAKAGEIQ